MNFSRCPELRWLRESASEARLTARPFFMVASFVNPHDIMFGNGNVPGHAPVQVAISPQVIPPPPESSTYERKWSFTLPQSLQESLAAPGMPGALSEYNTGWNGWFRFFGHLSLPRSTREREPPTTPPPWRVRAPAPLLT